MSKIKLAESFSVVFGPQVWLPFIIIATFLNTNLSPDQIKLLLPTTLIFQAILPMLYIYLALKFNKITAWDVPIRQQRYPFLLFVLFCNILSLFSLYFYGNNFILKLYLIMFLVAVAMAFITLFWKISIHASINTLGAIYVNYILGFNLPFLYLCIPVIFWARYTLKRHTIPQLLTGSIVTASIIILTWQILGVELFKSQVLP